MDIEVSKAINAVSIKVNNIERKLEEYLLGKHEENKEHIGITDGGLTDIAEILDEHDRAIKELSAIAKGV